MAGIKVYTTGFAKEFTRNEKAAWAGYAQAIANFRRMRSSHFALPDSIFADPAWDILIGLFIARMKGQMVNVTGACLYAEVPVTTALRYLRILETAGILDIRSVSHDRRVRQVLLTDEAVESMIRYLKRCQINETQPALA